jgi:hypothetical protein
MGHFVITFRIKSDDTYQDRYDSFTKKINELADKLWDETSSFYAVKAKGSAQSICDSLYFETDFVESRDLMLVVDLDKNEKAFRGPNEYPNTLEACLGF